MQEEERGQQFPEVILEEQIGGCPVDDGKRFADMRALILEEDALLRGYHMTMLERLGIECEPASDGEGAAHALKRADAGGYFHDVCFVGWNRQKGEKMVQALRGMAEYMYIICLAREEEADLGSVRAAGADELLIYPVSQATLYRFLTGLQKKGA